MRELGDEGAASFYEGVLTKTLHDQVRRRARSVRKARRKEIMQSIRGEGLFDFKKLYPVLKKYRAGFFYAYSRVLIESFMHKFKLMSGKKF